MSCKLRRSTETSILYGKQPESNNVTAKRRI